MIEKISDLLAGSKILFLIDDIIASETLDKRRQPLLELAISGRHRGHSLSLLNQSCTAIPNNIRRQAKMLYVWYPKNRTDLNTIHEENDVIETGELARVKAELKPGETYLFNYEDGTPKSLSDSLRLPSRFVKTLSRFVKTLSYYSTLIRTPDKRS